MELHGDQIVAAHAGGTFTVNAGTLVTNQAVSTNASFLASEQAKWSRVVTAIGFKE